LVPNNEDLSPSSVSFSITGGAVSPATASLFSATAWSSGKLDAYLGIIASPANPIGAYLSSAQALDPGATGFYVYQADLGTNTLPTYPATTPPDLTTSSTGGSFSPALPEASFVVGFLDTGTTNNPHWIATANNGALFETDAPMPSDVPEPTSLALLGTALLGAGLFQQRDKARPLIRLHGARRVIDLPHRRER
jgi:PEP-CTERM motif